MIVDKIGVEKEFWLLNENGNLVEPKSFDLPYDEFGFLVELRTQPHRYLRSLDIEYNILLHHLRKQIPENYSLSDVPRMCLQRDVLTTYRESYHWEILKDTTANIRAGTIKSHATGIDGNYGTAGLHIHFSRYWGEERFQLPITEIVSKMDDKFEKYINKANRITGEYEIKPYGFEYRSLPANAPLEEVVGYAFFILHKVKDYIRLI